jgi:UDP-N-acetylmuramyl pentapeptide phosphotransferase/UDP-N-acetylglucosamine-1-phosphate transferase
MVQAAAWLGLLIGTAACSASLIVLLRPLLVRYALARPNARSSHNTPTPQGAGVAVVTAALAGTLAAAWVLGGSALAPHLLPLVLAIVALALVGLVDDIAPLPPRLRIVVQTLAGGGLMLALPEGARALPLLPYWLELALEVTGLVWFVNLTNFMDGIDGMTVAGIVPPLAGIALLSRQAPLEFATALALIGALIGFAPFNRHLAKVFLGDVGSLAIGGITGWLLLGLACNGRLVAALILPLYYLADTGVTLFRRWRRGGKLSQSHREHCYQLASARGFSVPQVILRVWILNGALLALAVVAGATAQAWVQAVCLLLAGLLVAAMLRHLGGDGVP